MSININKEDIVSADWDTFQYASVRTITLRDGRVLFLAYDIARNILGLSNSAKLYNAVDSRSKGEAVITFVEDFNPQRYKFVDHDGLSCMVYRARKSEVNRLDFINWAKEKVNHNE